MKLSVSCSIFGFFYWSVVWQTSSNDYVQAFSASTSTSTTSQKRTTSMTTTTAPIDHDKDQPLLSLLQETFPTVTSYHVDKSIVQANANGFIVTLQHHEQTTTTTENQDTSPSQIFLKQVIASEYIDSKKDWPDLRRSMCYARTEARFYDLFLPALLEASPSMATSFPRVYRASCHLHEWVPEDEPANAVADASMDKDALPDPTQRGGVILLSVISPEKYYQTSPLTLEACRACLRGIAQLHAAAWENTDLLQKATQQLSKASFHLTVRNPKELATCVESWKGFLQAFETHVKQAGLWDKPSIHAMGERIAKLAQYISDQVTPSLVEQNDTTTTPQFSPYATLIHGDFKAMNAFLPKKYESACSSSDDNQHDNEPEDPVVLVDFASVGVGLGVSDVAMHIHHAVLPEDLQQGGEEALLRHYWESLNVQLRIAQSLPPNSDDPYPWPVALRQYRLAVVDYYRFFMARMWKGATPEFFAKQLPKPNVANIKRYPESAMAFIERVDAYLTEIEQEYENSQ